MANAVCFVRARWVSVAYCLLCVSTLVKSWLILQDYRLIHNQHYMAMWIIGAFLVVPFKRAVSICLLVSFYVWAGLLKLNPVWLSGEGLYGRHPLGLPTLLIPLSCAYVVLLEIVFSPALLSTRVRVWWFAYAQLLLFHLASWWVVGFFYPILMFLLLAIIPLSRYIPEPAAVHRPGLRFATVIVVVVFGVCQLAPRALSSDSAVTGEGRMLALHMFDALLECRSERIFREPDGGVRTERIRPRFVYPRIACDPLVHYQLALATCPKGGSPITGDFDFRLITRRKGGAEDAVVAIEAFCSNVPTYRPFSHNTWIREPGSAGSRR